MKLGRYGSVAVALATTIVIASACKKTADSTSAEIAASATPSRRPPARQRLSDEELRTLSATLLDAIAKGDADTASGYIDWPLLYARATTGLVLPDEARRGFLENVPQRTLFHQLVADRRSGGFLTLLRPHEQAGVQLLRFRLVLAEGGFNYVDLSVERGKEGRPTISDFFVAQVGEPMSATLRAQMLPFAAANSTLTSLDRAHLDHAKEIRDFGDHVREERFADALAAYERLAAPAQSLKSVQLTRVAAAHHAGAEAHATALDDLTLRFPDDPDVWMLALAARLERGELPAALEAIGGVDRAVGGDPYLDVQRSNVQAAAGKLDEALALAKKAAPALDMVVGYLTVVATSLRAEAFQDTLWALRALHERRRFDMGDLATDAEFTTFRRSPHYAEWLKARTATGAPSAR